MTTHLYSRQTSSSALETWLCWLRIVILSVVIVIALRTTFAHASQAASVSTASTTQSAAKTVDSEAQVKIKVDARGRKMQYVDFSDALIEGKARTPDGFVIQGRTGGRFSSLIELRSHFRDNINVHAQEVITGFGLAP